MYKKLKDLKYNERLILYNNNELLRDYIANQTLDKMIDNDFKEVSKITMDYLNLEFCSKDGVVDCNTYEIFMNMF